MVLRRVILHLEDDLKEQNNIQVCSFDIQVYLLYNCKDISHIIDTQV